MQPFKAGNFEGIFDVLVILRVKFYHVYLLHAIIECEISRSLLDAMMETVSLRYALGRLSQRALRRNIAS
jgi:hypothetical protein